MLLAGVALLDAGRTVEEQRASAFKHTVSRGFFGVVFEHGKRELGAADRDHLARQDSGSLHKPTVDHHAVG